MPSDQSSANSASSARMPANRMAIIPLAPNAGTVVPGVGPGRSHIERIVGTSVGAKRAPSHRPVTSPPTCAQLSVVPAREADDEVEDDEGDELAEEPARGAIQQGPMDELHGDQEPEQPEDRAGRSHAELGVPERERHQRAAGGRDKVEREEPRATVEALDERSREPQGVHVHRQVERHHVERRVDEGVGPQPPQLALRDQHLVQREQLSELPSRPRHRSR